jgi:hypothetical protein
MLSDAISNEKIRCQEKLFDHKGFSWLDYKNFNVILSRLCGLKKIAVLGKNKFISL